MPLLLLAAACGVPTVMNSSAASSAGCATRVAYAGRDGRIWTAKSDGTDRKPITRGPGLSPTWSPDGRRIVFRRISPGSSDIWIVDADGAHERRLTRGGESWSPTFSPDGRTIAYSSDRTGTQSIHVMAADGSGDRDLTGPQEGEYPAWSPDGGRLAFASHARSSYDIYVMRTDGSRRRNLTPGPSYDMYPAWSPDGRLIAFASDRGVPAGNGDLVQQEIYTVTPAGRGLRNLTRTPTVAEGFPAWLPDGRLSFVRGNDAAHPPRLVITTRRGTLLRTLLPDAQFPAWSRCRP